MRMQPMVIGHHYMASAGQYLATEAAHAILCAGGNAIDAGVAGGIALGVVHSDQVQFSGVAPMLIYLADRDETVSIAGLGWWPRALNVETFIRDHNGTIPMGILRTVVPAAPDAWILALQRYGTMSFGDVAASAIRYARDGFAVHTVMATFLQDKVDDYRRWPQNTAIYHRDGAPLREGDRLVQADLGRTIQFMVDQERAAAGRGRDAGLAAARDAFYRGDIARTIATYHRENGGLLTEEDLAEYRSEVENPLRHTFKGTDVFSCGPWCQGPVLLQILSMLNEVDLVALGHNSKEYIHLLAEVMNLCFADRERYYGDPHFAKVPIAGLLSKAYAAERVKLVGARAYPELPAPGAPDGAAAAPQRTATAATAVQPVVAADGTTHLAVIDRDGNMVCITPSGGVFRKSAFVAELGCTLSTRSEMFFLDETHANGLQPGKRPRTTLINYFVCRDGVPIMTFGCPGGDDQAQANLQMMLNVLVFGMDAQQAVEAPRFATQSMTNSFYPRAYHPGVLTIEEGMPTSVAQQLATLGHKIVRVGACGIGAVITQRDPHTGALAAGADPRRPTYAIAW
jgi:gamma-glutamyltranspeptidase/glutathione hydrolase